MGYGVMAGGLAAAFYGAGVGLVQKDSKTVPAYSSISQMGIITVPIGIALEVPTDRLAALTAVSVYAAHHAFAKGALLLGVGVTRTSARDKKRLAWIMAGLLIPALSLAGAPFTTGAPAKDALKRAMRSVPEPWQDMLAWMLSLAAIDTTVLLIRFLYFVRQEALVGQPSDEFRGYTWGLAVLGVLTLSWIIFTEPARAFLEHALEPAVLWSES